MLSIDTSQSGLQTPTHTHTHLYSLLSLKSAEAKRCAAETSNEFRFLTAFAQLVVLVTPLAVVLVTSLLDLLVVAIAALIQ